MNFFEQQRQAHQRTGLLLTYFALAILGTMLAVYGVLAGIALWIETPQDENLAAALSTGDATLWKPELFWIAIGGTLAVVLVSSGVKMAELSAGGTAVATALGGRHLTGAPADLKEKQLLNVVEEMAIASGVPRPEVFVLDNEPGINAFAAGFTPSDAAIGVTRGCLEQLSRDELQGVIAHEFSHLLNGDMRLNTRLIGALAGILGIAVVGRIAMEVGLRSSGRSSSKKGNPAALLIIGGIGVMIVGYIGLLFGRLIQAAISRQREFLADASAVQFTRNPLGILGALRKIGQTGSKLKSAHAAEASHMFFGNGLSEAWFSLWATHPPLEERIRRIDPRLAAQLESSSGSAATRGSRQRIEQLFDPSVPLPPQLAPSANAPAPAASASPSSPAGAPPPFPAQHLAYAAALIAEEPDALVQAAREPAGAAAIVYSTLLDPAPAAREAQLQTLADLHPAVLEQTRRLADTVAKVDRHHRLALIDIAIPSLRHLSPEQYAVFRQHIEVLVHADKAIDLFEFTLERIVRQHLDRHFGDSRPPKPKFRSVDDVAAEAVLLLSILAHVGQAGDDEVQKAFAEGLRQLALRTPSTASVLPPDQCGLDALETALDRLALATPLVRRNIIYSCGQTVAASGEVNADEAELLRAIAAVLDSPIPPLLSKLNTTA